MLKRNTHNTDRNGQLNVCMDWIGLDWIIIYRTFIKSTCERVQVYIVATTACTPPVAAAFVKIYFPLSIYCLTYHWIVAGVIILTIRTLKFCNSGNSISYYGKWTCGACRVSMWKLFRLPLKILKICTRSERNKNKNKWNTNQIVWILFFYFKILFTLFLFWS